MRFLFVLASLFLTVQGFAGSPTEPSTPSPQADAEPIIAHLPKGTIRVTADYHGERLLIYGIAPGDCDIIVKLSSPRVTVPCARRGRVGVFWMTVGKVTFDNVPWMYKIKSTRPLDQLLYSKKQIQYGLGKRGLIASIKVPPKVPKFLLGDLIKSRIEDRRYSFHENGIKRVKGNMFETSFFWPPKAQTGQYRIDSFAVRGGEVITVDSETVIVKTVGVEALAKGLAVHHGFLYGILAVVVAMASGLFVGVLFRGMGRRRRPRVPQV